jgi:hypothetical protein
VAGRRRVRENDESNYPGCWIAIPAAQLDRARCHHESHNIEKFKKKAGGRYAADLVLQLPARGVRFRCFALRLPELF